MKDKKLKILLVDDEPDILEFMEYNLKKENYEVFKAGNGREAIVKAKQTHPDLIILDIMMPEMDGIETCRALRDIPEFRKTMIAFLTARNEDYSQIAGFDVGADDYITKPIKPRVLVSRINALFRRYNTSDDIISPKASIFSAGDLIINREQYMVMKGDTRIELPRKEFELLALLASKAGIISAKARNIGILPDQYKIESFLQTDAAVNPGNSGGALVNTNGDLVGINSAIASTTGSFTGYSFAIPVNLVRKVMDDLVEFGSVQRGFIGVSIRDIDSKLIEEKGLKQTQGVFVAGLTEGGAASDAGLKEGDIIQKVGNVTVTSTPQLQEQIGRYRPGDKVAVTVLRDGKQDDFMLTLRNKDGDTKIVKNEEPLNLLGGTFENASQDEKSKLNIRGGVKISKLLAGKLRSAGIQEGFIITSIDKKPIITKDDLESALKTKQGGVLIEGVYPNGMKAYYGFGI